jgi:hypothetical protein
MDNGLSVVLYAVIVLYLFIGAAAVELYYYTYKKIAHKKRFCIITALIFFGICVLKYISTMLKNESLVSPEDPFMGYIFLIVSSFISTALIMATSYTYQELHHTVRKLLVSHAVGLSILLVAACVLIEGLIEGGSTLYALLTLGGIMNIVFSMAFVGMLYFIIMGNRIIKKQRG